ncbi:MAG: caspase family protein [Polyangiaceae bacterium]
MVDSARRVRRRQSPWLLGLAIAALLACKRGEPDSERNTTPGGTKSPPPTNAPPTNAPSANAPPTNAPPTNAPPTNAPAAMIPLPGGALLAGRNTYALIVGVLSFAEPGVAGWSAEQRKDRELYDTLRARDVPAENIELLLDSEATYAKVHDALERIARRAPIDSTLLFYYAGHGARTAGGDPYFVAYDTKSGAAATTGIVLSKVSTALRQQFHGQRVVLMADCCYSGSLNTVAKELADGKRVTTASLTSADASNLSTSNWTFTQAVIDGLHGDALADADRDGIITLSELAQTVAAEMKHRERQRHGFSLHGLRGDTPLANAPRLEPGSGPYSAGSYVLARDGSAQRPAQVRHAGAERSTVRFYFYNHGEDRQLDNAQLTKLEYRRYPKGSDLQVYWGGKLWKARITATDGDFHFITYPGWPAYWDEWVMSDRIAAAGDESASQEHVQIEWRGKWWPGVILKRRGDRFLVHYDGYGDEWDEWVTKARLKLH